MSEFLAEAKILVRPDTTAFRGLLEAELRAITAKPIAIPVVPIVATGITAATTVTNQFTVAQAGAAAETQAVAAALEKEAIAATQATKAQTAHAASLGRVKQGALSSGLSLFGVRGATLAASSGFLIAAASVTAFAKSIQSAANLETELNVFRVTASATADEMDRVAASAKQLGRDITLPGVTAGSAATAMTELAKAGLSVEDSIAGARGALQLATAAQLDVKQSTELVANALNAFGLEGADAVKIADLLAGAAKSAQGEIGEFGTALGQVASVADQFGVSAEDTVTLLTQLAKSGLQGGRAGTTLRVAILGLIKPTAAAAVELEKLEKAGVRITKPNGAFDPTAFAQINTALKKYSKEQQNVVRNTIFSSDAIKVLGRATAGGVQDFNAINAAVSEAGLAQEAARARTQGLAGDFENLSNQVSGLGLVIGQVASGPLSVLVRALAAQVGVLTDSANAVVTITGEIRKFSAQLAGAIPFLEDFKNQLEDTFGGGDGGGGVGESIKKGLLTGLNLLPSILIEIAKQFDNTAQEADKLKETLDELAKAGGGATFGLTKLSASVPDVGLGVKQIQNIITGFDAQEVRAKIAGDNAKLVDVLNTEQAFLEKQLTRDYVKRRPALKRAIEQALLGTVNDIQTIQSQAKSKAEGVQRDAKKAADDAAAAVKDREQALLSQFGVARDEQANKIAAAAQTAGLKDDIVRQKQLKALVLSQIAAVRERISIEGGRKAAIVALQTVLIQVQGSLKSLAQQQQQAAADQRQALLQGIGLDIDLAQITGDQAAEVKARNRKIAELNKDLAAEAKLHGKTTVAYKTIRNEIAAQNAALKEIQAERNKGQSFAQASFDFLQTQQSFASNLLGNLIPSGATGGMVGGNSSVPSALAPVSGFADGQSKSGPTAGQAQSANAILTGILNQLKILNGDNSAPEAQRQNQKQKSVMDY